MYVHTTNLYEVVDILGVYMQGYLKPFVYRLFTYSYKVHELCLIKYWCVHN